MSAHPCTHQRVQAHESTGMRLMPPHTRFYVHTHMDVHAQPLPAGTSAAIKRPAREGSVQLGFCSSLA